MAVLIGTHNACVSKTGSYWMIFDGVNAMIYGIPFDYIDSKFFKKSICHRSLIDD